MTMRKEGLKNPKRKVGLYKKNSKSEAIKNFINCVAVIIRITQGRQKKGLKNPKRKVGL